MNNDWVESFAAAAQAILHGQNPYVVAPSFVSPPWTLIFLSPLVWVPWWLAMLLPTVALVVLAVQRRKPYLILLVGTSFSFIALIGSLLTAVKWVRTG